jgi:hypothetical protein
MKLCKITLSTDNLWPLIILAGFGFFVSLVPLPPNDFWWHLKIGELIYTSQSIPKTNLFAWTLPSDTPFVYGAWLSELIFYILHRLGGLELITCLRSCFAVITFFLVGYEAKRKSGSWRLATLAVLLVCAMVLNNLPIRPQIFSWLPFVITLILLGKFYDDKLKPTWLLIIPLMMVLWVNLHGAFILGGVLIGIFFIGELVDTLLTPALIRTWNKTAWLFCTGALTGLAMFVNPRFTGIVSYVIDLMTDQPSQQLIEEWQSPTPHGIANVAFFISLLLFFVSLAYSRYCPKPTEILLFLSFLWLAWTGQRYVIWFGIVNMPFLIKIISHLPIKPPPLIPQRNFLNSIIVIVLFIPFIFVQPWFVENFPLPERYWKMVIPKQEASGVLIGVETPVKAVEYLRENPGGKIFNEMGYGSYLIWALPNQGVFVDPRVELYPYSQWEDYIDVINGIQYNKILDEYGADRILLDKELQPELTKILPDDSSWGLEYEDNRSQVWKKIAQIP